jgi:type II secretory pathway component PulJ
VNLADLLAALAIVGLVLAATLSVFAEGQRAYSHGAARVQTQQSARVALVRMAREIRQAGRGAGAFSPIAVAEPSRVVLQHDLDGDGVVAARGETIAWLLSAGVLRRDAGGGAQPIVNGVRALTFTYLDGEGRPASRADTIRTVAITLTTEPDHPAARGATRTTLTTEVRLRNR